MNKYILNYRNFLNENLSNEHLDFLLDKISASGINSLSNHEKTLLKSYSDKSIDVKSEIEKHINKFKRAKNVIKDVPLQVKDSELGKNIGRYVQIKKSDNPKKDGLLTSMGIIYEIVAVQKHWGYVGGEYVPNKIGYRIAELGNENSFGRPIDIDKIKFINISEEEAIKINTNIKKIID